jgi:hypothetical protein
VRCSITCAAGRPDGSTRVACSEMALKSIAP